jgi:SAM-dependent methyltransferase
MMDIQAESHSESAAANPLSSAASIPNFNYLARLYRWLEYLTFGLFLQRTRTHFLPELTHCRRALILGDGDGRFTARLLRTNPQIQVHAVDASPRMLHSLQKEAGHHARRVTLEIADIRHWHPQSKNQYDLIVTHFFLDCLTISEVDDLIHRLAAATTSTTLWLISEFTIPPTLFGRIIAAPLVACLYLAFHLLTNLRLDHLPDHRQALTASGWSLQSKRTYLCGLLVSELWSARFDSTPGE